MNRLLRSVSSLTLAAGFAFASVSPVMAGASTFVGEMPNLTPDTPGLLASLSSRPDAARMARQASPAQNFVRVTGAVKNLSLMLLHDVRHEAHVKAAIQQYGFQKVQATVVSAIRLAQLEYGAQWGNMLAGIYTARFKADELHSIVREKESSPHFIKLLSEQDAIAAAVKENGHDIYAAARAQVMMQLDAAL
ncbi:hypothetical protein [Kordiimonas sp.]|uniref:hypothetical protein n=1 Tax=Kordiimonas sp. TaxID=1970157 RepID=UPI003A8E8324